MKNTKRILSVMLAVLMVITAVPFAVFADNTPCTHPSTVFVPVKVPTCTSEGTINEVCSVCKAVISTKTVIKAEHDFSGEYIINGDGTHKQKCANCNVYTENEACSGGTAYCTRKPICEKCGGEYGEIDAQNHRFLRDVPAMAPTCTEDGYFAYKTCDDCGIEIDKQSVEKTGHVFSGACRSNGNGTHSFKCVKAGCEEYGDPVYCSGGFATCTVSAICQSCRTEYGEVDPDNHTARTQILEEKATCLKPGHNSYHHCAACNKDINRIDYPQLNHSFVDINNCINNGNGTHSFMCVNGCGGYGLGELPYQNGGYGLCSGGSATCILKAVCSACNQSYGEINPNNHINTTWVPGVSASCTNSGYRTYQHCRDCGKDINRENLSQLNHKFTGVSRCNENGTHSFRCVYGCGMYGADASCIDKNKDCICDVCNYEMDHIFTTYVYDEGSATCLDDGTKTAKCDNCQRATDTIVDEGSHLKVEHIYKTFTPNGDATCTKNGTKTGVCEVCKGCTVIKEDEGSLLGHSFRKYEYNDDAKCVENGTETAICERCDETDTQEAKDTALGHSFTNYKYNDDAKCLENGTETAKCDRCSETDTRVKSGTALSHIESEELSYHEGFDCTVGGIAYVKCLICDKEIGEKIVTAKEHMIVKDPAVASTCKSKGKTEGSHCGVCKIIIVAQETTEKSAHKFGSWTTKTAATCTKAGKSTRKCSVCSTTEEKTIKALGHSYSKTWTVDVKATCTKDGSKSHHCTRCSAKADVTKVAKTGHKYKDVVTTKATTEKDGKASQKCSVCSATTKAAKVAKISKIKLSKTSYVYDGKEKKPSVTVTDSAGAKLKSGTNYTIKYADGRKNVGSYEVKVTFKGKYSGSKKLTFKIVPPAISTVASTAGKKEASLSWSKPKGGATKYVVYYSLEKNGTYTKLKNTTTKTSCKITKLASGKTYYFKVRTCKTVNKVDYYSDYSPAVKVKVK